MISALLYKIHDSYENHCCEHPHTEVEAIDLSRWQEVYEKLAKDAYEGRLDPKNLDPTLVRETYNELNKGMQSGYGKDWNKVDKNGLANPVVIKMRQNLYKFSGAKTYTQLEDLNDKLTRDGKILSWNEFKTEALQLNKKYNLNYLQAEYQTAKQSAYHANNWEAFQRNKSRYPNLKYRTQNDARVREEHKALEGMIVPIDHPFWLENYPPNGWRCRCFVEQTKESADLSIIPETVPDVKPEFKINTGISGQIFSEDNNTPHNYFAMSRKQDKKVLKRAFELSKEYAPNYLAYESPKGAKVWVSIFEDKIDAIGNLRVAKKIADFLNLEVFIRAKILIDKYKNPEYRILGFLADRKEIDSATKGIINSFDKIHKQIAGKKILVIDLFKIKSITLDDITRQLENGIEDIDGVPTRGESIVKIIFVKNTAIMLDRADVINKKYEVLRKFIEDNYK